MEDSHLGLVITEWISLISVSSFSLSLAAFSSSSIGIKFVIAVTV